MRHFLVKYEVQDGENQYTCYTTVSHNHCKNCTQQIIMEEFEKVYGTPDEDDIFWPDNRAVKIINWHTITLGQIAFLNSIGIN